MSNAAATVTADALGARQPIPAGARPILAGGAPHNRPYAGMRRLASHAPTSVDIEWVCRAAAVYVANEGRIGFDQCLGLRGAADSWRIELRNRWIALALALLPPGKGWKFSRLELAWDRFLTAGPWRSWRDDSEPPPGATELQCAFFWASRHNRGESLEARQMQRIVGQISRSQCPMDRV